ncbi:hypothetical protein DM02DRAFT_730639 [Periconia macrospinosa]|uniref:Uncharacterized protein n=1 Tax=Periconia macrospinosa TaxID=97972 RepID=A0A2V1DI70_9PLEO|nr:hypothetical protein DM02DRAFT_730639 [Periconia macrospinosa]
MEPRTDEYWQSLNRAVAEQDKQLSQETTAVKNQKYRELFKDKEEMFEFAGWIANRGLRRAQASSRLVLPPITELQNAITHTNYRNDDEVQNLDKLLDDDPYVPLGTVNGIAYRLMPRSTVLQSDREPGYDPSILASLVYDYFLAIDFNSTHPASNDAPAPTEPDRSSNSDPKDDKGFVFFQLGDLEWTPCLPKNLTNQERLHGKWLPTDFVVVLRLSKWGKPSGIYIVYNFHPFNGKSGPEFAYVTRPFHSSRGRLRNYEKQIFCAKIAGDFGDFKERKPFALTEVVQEPKEIVRVIKNAEGLLLTQPPHFRGKVKEFEVHY